MTKLKKFIPPDDFYSNKTIKNYKDFNWCHPPESIRIDNVGLTISGLLTGCGLVQIYGVSYYFNSLSSNGENFKQGLIKHFKKIQKNKRPGAMIATLGQAYYHLEKKMLDAGFTFISEYPNPLHNPYKQRLYILYLDFI